MTPLQIVLAGYLAFGQPTGKYDDSVVKHAGLQVIHADGAVTLRLAETEREEGAESAPGTTAAWSKRGLIFGIPRKERSGSFARTVSQVR